MRFGALLAASVLGSLLAFSISPRIICRSSLEERTPISGGNKSVAAAFSSHFLADLASRFNATAFVRDRDLLFRGISMLRAGVHRLRRTLGQRDPGSYLRMQCSAASHAEPSDLLDRRAAR